MSPDQAADLAGRFLATGATSAFGTCGELAQGLLDGTPVMVTCPIDLFSPATVELSEGTGRVYGPVSSPQAKRAVAKSLALLGHKDTDARLHLASSIPRAKGMANSTADITAAIAASAAASRSQLSIQQQAELALAVEPSDGVMLPGIALFDYKGGRILQSLGAPPPISVLILEFPETVDTESFHTTNRHVTLERQAARFREALALIISGLERSETELIGRGATLSALGHQGGLPKPQLSAVITLGRNAGAAGVTVAHSGTVIGVLFSEDAERVAWASDQASKRLSGLQAVHNRRLIGSGVHQEPPENDQEIGVRRLRSLGHPDRP